MKIYLLKQEVTCDESRSYYISPKVILCHSMSYMLLKVICVTEGHIKCHSRSYSMLLKVILSRLYVTQGHIMLLRVISNVTQCHFICQSSDSMSFYMILNVNLCYSMSFYTGLKINGCKMHVFFILRLKIVMGTTKNVCAYFSKCSTKFLPFYFCPSAKKTPYRKILPFPKV